MHTGVFEVFAQFCKENPLYDCVLEITFYQTERGYYEYWKKHRDMFILVALCKNGGWYVSQKKESSNDWSSSTLFRDFTLENLHNWVPGQIEKFEIKKR
jgi:hypothetical protein